jgi:hypothetical protein
MRGSGESIIWTLAFELVPAAIFGSAAACASAIALALPRFDAASISAGAGAFALSFLALHRLGSGSKELPLAQFDQSELERELAIIAEEIQQAELLMEREGEEELILDSELHSPFEEELLLEDQLSPARADSRVVRLFDPRSVTAGEMHERIQRHLENGQRPPLSDATQELHEALSALRQSLR